MGDESTANFLVVCTMYVQVLESNTKMFYPKGREINSPSYRRLVCTSERELQLFISTQFLEGIPSRIRHRFALPRPETICYQGI